MIPVPELLRSGPGLLSCNDLQFLFQFLLEGDIVLIIPGPLYESRTVFHFPGKIFFVEFGLCHALLPLVGGQ